MPFGLTPKPPPLAVDSLLITDARRLESGAYELRDRPVCGGLIDRSFTAHRQKPASGKGARVVPLGLLYDLN